MTLRLAVWSGPRNVSTALMYAFAQRADTRVVDEPLYAAYLARGEGRDHPAREDVLAAQDADAGRVIEQVLLGPCEAPVLMVKHMAHHLRGLGVGWGFVRSFANVLLTREPRGMLASLARTLPSPTVDDTGLREQVALLHRLGRDGHTPVLVTAEEILADPRGTLMALCARVGLPFDEAMLSWPAGPKPYDGVWAPHWYAGTHASTGFLRRRTAPGTLPDALLPVLGECERLYDMLVAGASRI